MKTVEVTLYDIFGYLVPGIVALIGAYLVARPLVGTLEPLWIGMSATRWMALLMAAYLAGHFIQAVPNLFDRICRRDAVKAALGKPTGIEEAIIDSAKRKARTVAGLAADLDLDPRTLFDIMDHYLQQHGKTDTRDIYVYREGFYRGLAVAFLIFTVGCFARAIGDPVYLSLFGGRLSATLQLVRSLGILCVVLTVLAHFRFRRFSQYRVRNSLFSFLSVHKPTP